MSLAPLSQAEAPQAVLEFAEKWGPLELCVHGEPHRHSRCSPAARESMADWLRLARKVRAAHQLGAAVQQGDPGEAHDWAMILGSSETVPEGDREVRAVSALEDDESRRENMKALIEHRLDDPTLPSSERHRLEDALAFPVGAPFVDQPPWWTSTRAVSTDQRRATLSALIGWWSRDAGLYPTIIWEGQRAELEFRARTPWAAIVRHLLSEVAGVQRLALCPYCGTGFRPRKGQPRRGRRRALCGAEACLKEAAVQDKRNSRARRRSRSAPG